MQIAREALLSRCVNASPAVGLGLFRGTVEPRSISGEERTDRREGSRGVMFLDD